MDIPNVVPTGVARFLAATTALVLLYVTLDIAAFRLFDAFGALRATLPSSYAAAEADIRSVDEASRVREAGLPATHRLDAFDLGLRMGRAAQTAGQAVRPDVDAVRRAAALREAQALVDAGDLARRLTGAPASTMVARTFEDRTRLVQRIDADETGLAARLEAATTPRHRHLLLLGMHLGTVLWAPPAEPDLLGNTPPAESIALHASLAGLPQRLWEPLLSTPSSGTAAERRARYEAAVEAVRAALRSGAP